MTLIKLAFKKALKLKILVFKLGVFNKMKYSKMIALIVHFFHYARTTLLTVIQNGHRKSGR